MNLSELQALLISLLTRSGSNRVSGSDLLQACQSIVNFYSSQLASIIPDWDILKTFNIDGTQDGRYCKLDDANGNSRIFESKTSTNIGNLPPTDPSVHENYYWKEVSQSASAAIPEYAPGVFGPGLVIVYHNHSNDGRGLYLLTEAARPFSSTNIETEILAAKWARLGGSESSSIGRTWSSNLLFDKTSISYGRKIMTADINFTLAAEGNLSTTMSSAKQVIQADGVHKIFFDENFEFKIGITSGQILPAGSYQFFFLYDPSFGTVTVNVPGVTSEGSSATQLSAPTDFIALPDGEDEMQLSWNDVNNEISYLIEYSLDGIGGWSTLSTPAAGTTSATQTGLTAGTTRYYRMKAIGNGSTFLDSVYVYASATTADAGDSDAPVPSFSPAAAATEIPVNQPIVITFDEEIYNIGGSDIVSNQAGILTVKETNSGGANIPGAWVIAVDKKSITFIPTDGYGGTQLVYVAVNNFEDINGNDVTVAISSTFTTNDFTTLNGNNAVIFSDILDSLFAANDTNFWVENTIKNWNGVGAPTLGCKYSNVSSQVTFYLTVQGSDVFFAYFGTSMQRRIKWTGAVTSPSDLMTFVLKYDGSIDTNNGLDRATLLINGVTKGSKSLDINTGTLSGTLKNTTAQLSAGATVPGSGVPESNFFTGLMKDFIIRSNNGATVELNIPVLKDGIDISGNGRDATWV